MGHSFFKCEDRVVRVRDFYLGVVCAIIAKESEELPESSELQTAIQPLRKHILERAHYYGITTVIELAGFFPSAAQRRLFRVFLQSVVTKLQAFGSVIPKSYMSSLPHGEFYGKETWTTSEVREIFNQVEKLVE